jgi:hypothetical protein
MKDVRTAPFHKRAPLCNAEAMLLVDDRDREVVEVDLLLDERVCTDNDCGVT